MSETPPKHRATPPAKGGPPAAASAKGTPPPKGGPVHKAPPGGAKAAGVKRPIAKVKRKWPRRTLIGANAVVFLCLVAMGSAYGWARDQIDGISTLPGPGLSGTGKDGDGKNMSTSEDGNGLPAMNILLIGNETRKGLTESEQQWLGSSAIYSGSEADIMMVLHLDPKDRTASILSIPRDLFSPMPANSPVGSFQKLDAALNDGNLGPNNLSVAIQQDFGIPINAFIELNFNGFINSVNALGGINVYFPERVYDAESLLYVTQPGCHHLNGRTALSLVRARHLQYDPPGDIEPNYDWPQEPESDLARIVRTHTFIKLVAAKARSEFSNPLDMANFVSAVLQQMTVNSKLRGQLLEIVKTYVHLNLDSVPELTLPTTGVANYSYGGYGMGDVVFPVQPLDINTIKEWDSQALPAPVKPSAVQVISIAGDYDAAVAAGQALASDGLKISNTNEAEEPGSPSETLVLYRKDSLAQALDVMKYLSGAVMLQQDSTVAPHQVIVDLGSTVSVKSHPVRATTTTGPATTTTAVVTTTVPVTSTTGTGTTSTVPAATTTTVPTPGGTPPSAAKDVEEPWDPRSCPPGSKVLNGA